MRVKDAITLATAKLSIRKLRTVITIFTASLLFGVIITVLFVSNGFFKNLTSAAEAAFGNGVTLVVNREAAGLGGATSDTEATALNDQQNKASNDALTKVLKDYRGVVEASMNHYCSRGPVLIEPLTPSTTATFLSCIDNPGESIITISDDSILAPLTKKLPKKDDVIQIIIPFDQAAKVAGVDQPLLNNLKDPDTLMQFLNNVNNRAIGLQFKGQMENSDISSDVTYEIVGLIPSKRLTTLDPQSINPLVSVLYSLASADGSSESYSFIATNPDSTAFQAHYSLNRDRFTTDSVVTFQEISDAERYIQEQGHASEFISNKLDLRSTSRSMNRLIEAFTILFTIIAAIIMAGTISRVIDDERQTIALYRAVGATRKNILYIFTFYISSISLLVILCSTLIAIILTGIITALYTGLITANIGAMYNIPSLSLAILIGFDIRVILIYLAIIIIGLACLLLVARKLTIKNLSSNLRQ